MTYSSTSGSLNLADAQRKASLALEQDRGVDAVVVGAGACGGLAALLLCEAGLNVLVLDAGWPTPLWRNPLRAGTAALMRSLDTSSLLRAFPPGLLWRGQRLLQRAGRLRQPVQSTCYAWVGSPDQFVDDIDCPYEAAPDQPFTWIRARQPGGRMVVPLHGREYLRLGEEDLHSKDGRSPQWPIDAATLDPFYEQVEKRLDITGARDGCSYVPDSHIEAEARPTPQQDAVMKAVQARWPAAARPILGRFSPPLNSLEQAAQTGRLLFRSGAIGRHVETEASGRACGVTFFDCETGAFRKVSAPLVFLCASTLESTRMLLLSSGGDGRPIGHASGMLGRNLMDHVSVKAAGMRKAAGLSTASPQGACVYLPRFDLREGAVTTPTRGYAVRLYSMPSTAETSYFIATADAEMLPRTENFVALSNTKDKWGIPVLRISCSRSRDEIETARMQKQAIAEVVQLMDVQLTEPIDLAGPPGSAIHECGTARMGTEPENSVLDPTNQCWEARGLYVTDGSSFPSQGLQSPTLTIMALTARACAHASGKQN